MLRRAGAVGAVVMGAGAVVLGDASPAAAASGSFDGNPAITATYSGTGAGTAMIANASGTGLSKGVQVESQGIGVDINSQQDGVRIATSSAGSKGVTAQANGQGSYALEGVANQPYGVGLNVVAQDDLGTAIYAEAGDLGAHLAGKRVGAVVLSEANGLSVEFSGAGLADFAHIWLAGAGVNAPIANPNRTTDAGVVVYDDNGDLWVCVQSGTPGEWRKLAGASTAGSLHMLATPTRCYDSRPYPPSGGAPKGVLIGGTQRTIDTKNNNTGVPAGATAVLVNVTVADTSVAGFLALYSNALASWPGTSNLNWDHSGQQIANLAVVAVDSIGQLKAYANTDTDLLIDVIGYYR